MTSNPDAPCRHDKLKAFCVALVAAACGCSSQRPAGPEVLALLNQHAQHHAVLQVEDVYKMLYQGSLGIEHLLTDTVAAKNYLAAEWRDIPGLAGEPLFEVISPDSQWVRLNLKPFKAAGGNTESIWQAMVRSARTGTERKIFVQRWKEFVALVDGQQLPYGRNEVHAFDRKMAGAGYPAVHHSQAYRETEKPAYRVLVLAEARLLARHLSIKNPL